MSVPCHLIAWKSSVRGPLYVSSRCVGVSQFISTCAPSESFGPSSSAKIRVGDCEPVVQLRFTNVPGSPVPIPLVCTVWAVATIFPSGDRLSADQVVLGPSQPLAKTDSPNISAQIGLWIEARPAPNDLRPNIRHPPSYISHNASTSTITCVRGIFCAAAYASMERSSVLSFSRLGDFRTRW